MRLFSLNILIEKIIGIEEIFKNISIFNDYFIDSIENRVGNLWDYSVKISCYGNTYVVKIKDKTVGIIVFYANDLINKTAYITMIAVANEYEGMGIGKELLTLSEFLAVESGMEYIKLEVHKENMRAIRFYEKCGFSYLDVASDMTIFLRKELNYATMDKEGQGI